MAGEVRASATILSASCPDRTRDSGDSAMVSDLLSYRFGKERWDLVLDVQLPGQPPYRVTGHWKVPNRLWKIRKVLDGPGRLFPGIVVPVVVNSSNPQKIEIDWDDFKRSGADSQLYPETGSVRRALSEALADLRSDPAAVAKPQPSSPRPTAAAYPPIEGVDYDTWIAAVVSIVRNKVKRRDQAAHYECRGFPAGRGEAVSAAWYDRVKADENLRTWYVYDCDNLKPL